MTVQLCCSEGIKVRLNKLMLNEGIGIDERSHIVLIEEGYALQEGKICIVFDPLDFNEAFELIRQKNRAHLQGGDGECGWEKINDRIVGYYNDRYALINPNDILYIEVNKNEVTCVTKDKKYFLKQPLYFYESLLREKGLVKINKSQLGNLLNVDEIIPWFNSRLILLLKNNIRLEVSKKYSQVLRKAFDL